MFPPEIEEFLNYNQIKILELKIKFRANIILDIAKDGTNDLGAVPVVNVETEAWRENRGKRKSRIVTHNMEKMFKECFFKCWKWEERENETQVFEVMMLDNRQTLMTDLERHGLEKSPSP